MLDYRQLSALLALSHEGSFERAAARLNVTSSALSQRIKSLEAQIGGRVVIRGPKLRLTALGTVLAQHAQQVQMMEGDILAQLYSESDLPGSTVKIAVNADSLATWFMQVLCLAAADPDLRLYFNVVLEDQEFSSELLKNSEVVAAISEIEMDLAGIRSVRLGHLDYVAVASPAFVQEYFPNGVTPEALSAAPSLRFSSKDSLQMRWAHQVVGSSIVLSYHTIPSSHDFVRCTEAGLGWSMNPRILVAEQLRSGTLKELLPDHMIATPLFWHCPTNAPSILTKLTRIVTKVAARSLRAP